MALEGQESSVSVCTMRGFHAFVNQVQGSCLYTSYKWDPKPHTYKCSLVKIHIHKWQHSFCPVKFQVADLCLEINWMLELTAVVGKEIFIPPLYLITAKTVWDIGSRTDSCAFSGRSCRDGVICSLTASQQGLGSSVVWNLSAFALWVLTGWPASVPKTVQKWVLVWWLLISWRKEHWPW